MTVEAGHIQTEVYHAFGKYSFNIQSLKHLSSHLSIHSIS